MCMLIIGMAIGVPLGFLALWMLIVLAANYE